MQHSKGWDDFGKPPFNFYKVSPTCVASLPSCNPSCNPSRNPSRNPTASARASAWSSAWDSAWACTKSSACESKPQPQPQPEPEHEPEPSTCCQGFDEFMAVFPDEDRELYPEMFKLPAGCYEARSPCRENKAAQPRAGRLLRSLFRRSRTRLPRASANEPNRSGRIEGGRPHRPPARHTGGAAQAAGHRFRGGGARKGRGGRLPGGGLERGAVRADTAGGHTHRRDRVQGASLTQPPALSVCRPVWLCIHRSCIHPYSRLVLPSIERDQPRQSPLCPPCRHPPP